MICLRNQFDSTKFNGHSCDILGDKRLLNSWEIFVHFKFKWTMTASRKGKECYYAISGFLFLPCLLLCLDDLFLSSSKRKKYALASAFFWCALWVCEFSKMFTEYTEYVIDLLLLWLLKVIRRCIFDGITYKVSRQTSGKCVMKRVCCCCFTVRTRVVHFRENYF